MGIPGILREIGKGERTALSKLSIEFLERHNRPLRIAVDAAIWNFQTQSGQGGKNPALRTLFFRLLKLFALPIQPVFVYDGKNKPLTKRGRTVRHYKGTCIPNELSKVLVRKFCYPWHIAPGEAEAECALLQKKGVVDMVMSQDADAMMFGAGVTLRDWSKEGIRGNKGPTHVNVMNSVKLKEISGLDSDGMILVALLSGGDYDEAGVPGFGAALACEVARAGFGTDLIDLVKQEDLQGLKDWRERLQYELETNESGYFKRKHKTLSVPENFPDLRILGYYLKPAVSSDSELQEYEAEWAGIWNSEIDVVALREYTASMLDWRWKSGARRFTRCFAQPLFQDRLRRRTINVTSFTVQSISERRMHFVNDGIPELRLSAIPADVVGIDIEAEEDNPDHYTEQIEDGDEEPLILAEEMVPIEGDDDQIPVSSSPSKRRKTPAWNPYILEKWWIPETLLQLGLSDIVEDWHQLQRDLQAEQKKPIPRKTTRPTRSAKNLDNQMMVGALRNYFTKTSKPSISQNNQTAVATRDHCDLHPDLDGETSSQEPHKTCGKKDTLPSQTRSSQNKNTEQTTSSRLRSRNSAASRARKTKEAEHNKHTQRTMDKFIDQNTSSPQRNLFVADSERLSTFVSQLSKEVTDCSTSQANGETDFRNQPSSLDNPSSQAPQGRSLSSAITIDSSPITPKHTESLISEENMTRVTQRKPRPMSNSPRKTRFVPEPSPTRQRRPIESFFMHRPKPPSSDVSSDQDIQSIDAQCTSQSLSRVPRGRKAAAVARDSLPGTWKEIDIDSAPRKNAPRVSFVDLSQ